MGTEPFRGFRRAGQVGLASVIIWDGLLKGGDISKGEIQSNWKNSVKRINIIHHNNEV